MKRNVELEAAEALLDVGISLPLFRIRMPWGKGWTWRVVMRRPCLGSQMRIARQFLKLGITSQQVERFTDDQERAFFVEHLRELSMMVAFAVCRSYLSGLILAPVVAWLIRWKVPPEYLVEAQRWFKKLRSTRDFTDIIASAETINPFRPAASQKSPISRS